MSLPVLTPVYFVRWTFKKQQLHVLFVTIFARQIGTNLFIRSSPTNGQTMATSFCRPLIADINFVEFPPCRSDGSQGYEILSPCSSWPWKVLWNILEYELSRAICTKLGDRRRRNIEMTDWVLGLHLRSPWSSPGWGRGGRGGEGKLEEYWTSEKVCLPNIARLRKWGFAASNTNKCI